MFWDSSALVPCLLSQRLSEEMRNTLHGDRGPAIWWATPVECQSAIYRIRSEATPVLVNEALERLAVLIQDACTVAPNDELRQRAGRLLASYRLRAADALQLAAALIWCEERAFEETFVCLDNRLRDAARLEGSTLYPG